MASPFKFFRKYSGGMMVVMVILSMLLFTLTDLFSDPSANLWLLGLLLGGAVFGIAGAGQGRWLQWGLGGAVLGTVLGYVLPGFVGGSGLSTSLGVIDEQAIYDLEIRRAVANQVIFQSTEATFGEGTGRFATLFGFGHNSNREDVIFGKLLRAEADRLGITVSDQMVGDYLKRVTNEQLTADTYVSIRNNLTYNNRPVNDELLNEILGDEIKARMAFQMLRPRTSSLPPGPEVYWDYFKRLNVRQQVSVAALDVDAFLDEVGEPSDSELNEMFAVYARKFPNQEAPGSPGFRLPFRAKLAYVELDSEQIETDIGEISDEEIQKYYDDNKETPMIRTPVLPDAEEATPAESKEEPATREETKTEGKKEPAKKEPKTDAEASKPTAAEDKKPEPKAAAEEKGGDASDVKEAEESKEDDGSCGPDEDEASAGEEAAPEAEDDADTTASKTEAAADEETKDASKPADSETLPLIVPSVPAAPAADKDDTPEIQYEYRELDDELKAEIREELLRQKVKETIDEKMQAAITQMDTLSRERSKERFALLEKDPKKYDGSSGDQQEALRELRESMEEHNVGLAADLKKFANENGMAYVETPLLSYAELLESEDYAVGVATEPNPNPMMAAQTANVALTLFQSFSNDEQNNDAQLFLPRRAQLRGASLDDVSSHYAYWAVDFSTSHVPTLDEPGIKEAVAKAWKRGKARELVLKRGEQLAESIREGLKKEGDDRADVATTLKDETVTGKEDGAAMAVRRSLPFSWMRTSSASPMSFQQQQASLSPINFEDSIGGQLEKVGEEFMKAVFDDMKDEDVSVIPNADLSKYFVVHVANRFPTPEVGEDGLRERFATEGQQFAFAQSPILGAMQQQLGGPASIAWERGVWERYGVDPDGEPDEE